MNSNTCHKCNAGVLREAGIAGNAKIVHFDDGNITACEDQATPLTSNPVVCGSCLKLRAEVERKEAVISNLNASWNSEQARAESAELQLRDYQTALQTIGDWDHHDLCDRRDPMIKTKPCNCFVKLAEEVLRKYGAGRCGDCGTSMDVHPGKDCTQ